MLKQSERNQIISFFHSLQSINGGFSDRNNAFGSVITKHLLTLIRRDL